MPIINKVPLINEVKRFAKMHKKDKFEVGLNNFSYPANAFFAIDALIKKDFGTLALAGSFATISRDICVSDHNIAMENAARLAKRLKRKGFSKEERIFAVKKYLKKDGNLIFTTLFRLTNKRKINDLADGKKVKSHIPSLFPKFWERESKKAEFKSQLA